MNVSTPDAKHRKRTPLITGHEMTCPRCRVSRDILDFQRFGEIEEFSLDTAPIYKCPKARGGCGWIFAPAEHTVMDVLSDTPIVTGGPLNERSS